MPVLVLIANDESRQCVLEHLRQLQLEIVAARTFSTYRKLIRKGKYAAVICDTELPDGTWVDVLGTLTHEDAPLLIVTSRVADDHLWVDVLHRGGYDVLAQPFERSEVARVISLARDRHHRRKNHPGSTAGTPPSAVRARVRAPLFA